MRVKKYPSVHPGKILLKEFIECFGLTQSAVAEGLDVPRGRISEIVQGKRAISAETALRLSVYFGNSAEFWMNLQARYELKKARDQLGDRLEEEVKTFGY